MTEVQTVLAIVAQLTVLVAAVGAGLLWFKRWVKRQVADPLGQVQTDVSAVQLEVTTNQGNSMKDAVDSTALAVGRTEAAVAHLTTRFDDHLILGHGGGSRNG